MKGKYCSICPFFTTKKYNMDKHLSSLAHIRLSNDQQFEICDKYKCDDCNDVFNTSKILKYHQVHRCKKGNKSGYVKQIKAELTKLKEENIELKEEKMIGLKERVTELKEEVIELKQDNRSLVGNVTNIAGDNSQISKMALSTSQSVIQLTKELSIKCKGAPNLEEPINICKNLQKDPNIVLKILYRYENTKHIS